MKFNDLGLEPGLQSAVADHGYETPKPMQAAMSEMWQATLGAHPRW